MGAEPSYYDSIGLLAICDAIDSVDGIPFHPSSNRSSISNDSEVRSRNSSVQGENGMNISIQHPFLTHIPVTGVIGSMPYDEQQRVAINQLASTGQLPPQLPPHSIGGVRPNIPVAHNLQGNKSGSHSNNSSVPGSPSSRKSSIPQVGSHTNSPLPHQRQNSHSSLSSQASPQQGGHISAQELKKRQLLLQIQQQMQQQQQQQQQQHDGASQQLTQQQIQLQQIQQRLQEQQHFSRQSSPAQQLSDLSPDPSQANSRRASITDLSKSSLKLNMPAPAHPADYPIPDALSRSMSPASGAQFNQDGSEVHPMSSYNGDRASALAQVGNQDLTSHGGEFSLPNSLPNDLTTGALPDVSGNISDYISGASNTGYSDGLHGDISGLTGNLAYGGVSSSMTGESDSQGFRVEVCQICGRDFKGRKAATHKQQHIRRLHPTEYTPKRGGKKSRVE